ncbi:MAG: class I SAM-dependent methyltransferase [Actinomycetota bacterium]
MTAQIPPVRSAWSDQYSTGDNLRTRMELHSRFRVGDEPWPRWLFDRMSISDGARILELGCGTGLLWRFNADRLLPTWRLCLTDLSDGMLKETRAATSDLSCRVDVAAIDAQAVALPDASVDVVVAAHMLYHVPDRERALGEIRRVLGPEGRLYASTIGSRYLQQVVEVVADVVPTAPPLFAAANEMFGERHTAPDLLDRWFPAVDSQVFDEQLHVTEAEAVTEYLRSLPGSSGLRPEDVSAVGEAVREEIRRHGAFTVDAPSVLFTCSA